jgi:hypothetical protein
LFQLGLGIGIDAEMLKVAIKLYWKSDARLDERADEIAKS